MANEHIAARMAGVMRTLMGVHQSSAPLSAASKGAERAAFVDSFLAQALPAPFRVGTGDATDRDGRMSGQLDIVVEFPFLPSLPLPAGGTARLYLAESIAAVVEVKSHLSAQWAEALRTGAALATLERSYHDARISVGPEPLKRVPYFVVGYKGWRAIDTAVAHLSDGPVDGILIIDNGIFVSTDVFSSLRLTGSWALWGMLCSLHTATSGLVASFPRLDVYAQ